VHIRAKRIRRYYLHHIFAKITQYQSFIEVREIKKFPYSFHRSYIRKPLCITSKRLIRWSTLIKIRVIYVHKTGIKGTAICELVEKSTVYNRAGEFIAWKLYTEVFEVPFESAALVHRSAIASFYSRMQQRAKKKLQQRKRTSGCVKRIESHSEYSSADNVVLCVNKWIVRTHVVEHNESHILRITIADLSVATSFLY